MAGKKGIPKSPETRAKISAALRASWTDERKEKASRISRERGINVGRKWSPEHRAKNAQYFAEHTGLRRGATLTLETRALLSWNRSASTLSISVTREEYIAQFVAGNQWCHFGKHFIAKKDSNPHRAVCNEHASAAFRFWSLQKSYGITPDWYDAKLAEQGGFCGICCNGIPSKGHKHLAVDHSHVTGAIRGLLCARCNAALERLDSVPDWALRALAYLQKYS